MTRQEQIEEMAKCICNVCDWMEASGCMNGNVDNYTQCSRTMETANAIYNAGYRKIDDLKAENKQLKTECALLDDELRIARQETIDVLNELKTKAFDKDAFNGWAGSTFVVLVRDIDKMIEELTKCRR